MREPLGGNAEGRRYASATDLPSPVPGRRSATVLAVVPFLMTHGFNLRLLVQQLFANRISSFFGLDVLVSSAVLWIFVGAEGRRLNVRHTWAPLLAILTVGVSRGLPQFLYLREDRLDERPEQRPVAA